MRTQFARGLLMAFAFAWAVIPASAQPESDPLAEAISKLQWQTYPAVGAIGDVAQISLASDLRFLDSSNTSRFLELNGNPPRDDDYALAPSSLRWFAVFSFDNSGYVKDDEQLDSDELLRVLKEGNRQGMEERRKLSLPVLTLEGWSVPPHYDAQTHRLEWGTRLTTEDGSELVNYTIRILGRTGVMSALLVSEPQYLETDIAEFKTALQGYDFVSGQSYAEFRQGDRVAEYGLGALVVGGAAAVAAKTGLFQVLGKFLFVFIAGAFAAIGAVYRVVKNRLFKQA